MPAALQPNAGPLAAPRNCPGERPFFAHAGDFPFPAGDRTMRLIFGGPALLGIFSGQRATKETKE